MLTFNIISPVIFAGALPPWAPTWRRGCSRERERESQFNTAGGSEFQVRGAAVLNDRLANDIRQNGTHISGTDDGRVLRALVRNELLY